MGYLSYFLFPWGILLQALAVIHFIRRRPDTYWLWIIIVLGPLGALVYLVVEAAPDVRLLGGTFQGFSRRKRIQELERLILDNPAAGNYEELGILLLDERNYLRAKECFDKAISSRTDHADPFYRRAICELELGESAAARADLERVIGFERKYDYQRALGLLAHAYAKTGENEKAAALFREATETSTLSETQLNYAAFLASQGKTAEAREMAQTVLRKKATLPGYLKRRERPWFRKAQGLLKQLPAA